MTGEAARLIVAGVNWRAARVLGNPCRQHRAGRLTHRCTTCRYRSLR